MKITGRIDLVHCNDSRDEFDSGADRHANFGHGRIDPERLAVRGPRRRRPGGLRDPGRRRGAPGRLRVPARAGVTHRPTSRRALLAAGGLAVVAGCASPRDTGASAGTPTVRPVRHHYGPGRQQVGDLYLPADGRPRGTVVVIHGGFWQSMYGLDLGAATSADLAQRGWAAWNIEYRRLGDGGGWPNTFTDVAAAVDHLRRLDGVDPGSVVTLGHSAGGQLAVWAASRAAGRRPAAAAGAGDRGRLRRPGCSPWPEAARPGSAAAPCPAWSAGCPAGSRAATGRPTRSERLPLGVPVRCVHGTDDTPCRSRRARRTSTRPAPPATTPGSSPSPATTSR